MNLPLPEFTRGQYYKTDVNVFPMIISEQRTRPPKRANVANRNVHLERKSKEISSSARPLNRGFASRESEEKKEKGTKGRARRISSGARPTGSPNAVLVSVANVQLHTEHSGPRIIEESGEKKSRPTGIGEPVLAKEQDKRRRTSLVEKLSKEEEIRGTAKRTRKEISPNLY